jgi:hypothetical protein
MLRSAAAARSRAPAAFAADVWRRALSGRILHGEEGARRSGADADCSPLHRLVESAERVFTLSAARNPDDTDALLHAEVCRALRQGSAARWSRVVS